MSPLDGLAGGSTDPAAALMSQLDTGDPLVAMVMKLIGTQQEAARKLGESADDPDDPMVADLERRLAETEHRLAQVSREAKQLLSAHRAARARLADLAAALGACGLCWGDDPECPSCRGRGHVGMSRPDPEIRARLLGPARPVAQPAGPQATSPLQ